MGSTTITSATKESDGNVYVCGRGPANTAIYLSKDGHGAEFGRGMTDNCGNFRINAGQRGSDVYDWVVIALNCGVMNEAQDEWSQKYRLTVY